MFEFMGECIILFLKSFLGGLLSLTIAFLFMSILGIISKFVVNKNDKN